MSKSKILHADVSPFHLLLLPSSLPEKRGTLPCHWGDLPRAVGEGGGGGGAGGLSRRGKLLKCARVDGTYLGYSPVRL